MSNIAKESIEEYKRNASPISEARFKQANLNLTDCLYNLSSKTQAQLHSLLGSQGVILVQKIVNTIKVKDIVQDIIYDFVKVGRINEQLGIKPDPLVNKCFWFNYLLVQLLFRIIEIKACTKQSFKSINFVILYIKFA